MVIGFENINEEKRTKKSKVARHAFTLAEVLIVIGVIGVVAAITIPTLIPLIKEKVNENRKEVIEDRLIQGLNQLNTLDDGFNGSQYATAGTEGFVKALSKHYKMSQICGANDLKNCFPYNSLTYTKEDGTTDTKNWSDLKTPEDFGLKSDEYYTPAGFISSQGTSFVMLLKKDCIMDTGEGMRAIPTSCIQYMYDNNGSNIPNKIGIDLVNSEGLVVGKIMPKAILGGVKIMTNAFTPEPLSASDCNDNKSAYGITLCLTSNYDYWGGAMKYCKEHGWKLPTDQQLVDIANALYKGMNANTSPRDTYAGKDANNNYYTIGSNEPLPEALSGLSTSYIRLWSDSEYRSSSAYFRNFQSYSTYVSYDTRNCGSNCTNFRAVCVSD